MLTETEKVYLSGHFVQRWLNAVFEPLSAEAAYKQERKKREQKPSCPLILRIYSYKILPLAPLSHSK